MPVCHLLDLVLWFEANRVADLAISVLVGFQLGLLL